MLLKERDTQASESEKLSYVAKLIDGEVTEELTKNYIVET